MRFRTQRNHMIDFLFPVALFFVFAVSALTVILLATNVYRSTTEHSSLNFTAGTSLSYISEKIHQSDENGKVSLGTFDGLDALIIEQEYKDEIYFTYIYTDQNELKELFVKEGVEVNASSGKSILPIESFTMEAIGEHAYSFTCVDKDGQKASSVVSIRSTAVPLHLS